jgi:hypothetical protein
MYLKIICQRGGKIERGTYRYTKRLYFQTLQTTLSKHYISNYLVVGPCLDFGIIALAYSLSSITIQYSFPLPST